MSGALRSLVGKTYHIRTFGCQMNERDSEKLEGILGANGTLFLYHDGAWSYNGTEQEFLEKLEQEEFALELVKLEHRRWCFFMASKGWRAGRDGKKNEDRLINPCMVILDKLMEQQPYMVKYDLMPLLAEYVRN